MAKDKPRIKLGIPNLHRTRALIEGKKMSWSMENLKAKTMKTKERLREVC